MTSQQRRNDKRRLSNEDGKLHDIPVTSDKERYGKKVTTYPAHEADRRRLQSALHQFMAIKKRVFAQTQSRQEIENLRRETKLI